MEHVGIENIKKMAHFAVALVNAMGTAYADKTFDKLDAMHFIRPLMELGGALASAKQSVPELKDLDAQERQELIAYMTADLKLSGDKVEASVERLLELMAKFHEIFLLLKK